MTILIEDDVAWLPIPMQHIDIRLLNDDVALGTQLREFLVRARDQWLEEWDKKDAAR